MQLDTVTFSGALPSALRELMGTTPDHVLAYHANLNETPERHEFLAHEFEVRPAQAPLPAWRHVVIVHLSERPRHLWRTAEELSRVLRLGRKDQEVAVCVMGLGHAAGAMAGLLRREGEVRPLHRVSVVAPGLPRVDLESHAGSISVVGREESLSRLVGGVGGEANWRRVADQRYLIVGASRGGMTAGMALAAHCVREIVLCDPDVVEEGNLDLLWMRKFLGAPKVEALAQVIAAANPAVRVGAVAEGITTPAGIAALKEADVVVSTVDSDAARAACAILSSAYLKPHLDFASGIHGQREGEERRMGCDLRILLNRCLFCAGSLSTDAERALQELAGNGEAHRPARPFTAERDGSNWSLNQLFNLGILHWIDVCRGVRGDTWVHLEMDATGQMHIENPELREQECRVCALRGRGDRELGWIPPRTRSRGPRYRVGGGADGDWLQLEDESLAQIGEGNTPPWINEFAD